MLPMIIPMAVVAVIAVICIVIAIASSSGNRAGRRRGYHVTSSTPDTTAHLWRDAEDNRLAATSLATAAMLDSNGASGFDQRSYDETSGGATIEENCGTSDAAWDSSSFDSSSSDSGSSWSDSGSSDSGSSSSSSD